MNDLIVIAAASCEGGTLPLYRKQLADAGIDFHVEDISGMSIPPLGGNSEIKTNGMIDLSRRFSHYKKIIFTDAFDMCFFGNKDETISKIPEDYVLWAAEKNCYPDQAIAPRIPDRGPHRFGNGGFLCGTPDAMIAWAEKLRVYPGYNGNVLDQQYLNISLADNDDFVRIDHQTNICFCLYGGYSELEFENGKPVNTMYGTHPQFIHANGHWDASQMWAKHAESLK